MTDDPVLLELLETGTNVRPIKDELSGLDRELEPKEVDAIEQIISELPLKETLTAIIETSAYQGIQDYQTRSKILRNVITNFRKAAKGIYLAKNMRVTDEMINDIVSQAHAILGWETTEDHVKALYHFLPKMRNE